MNIAQTLERTPVSDVDLSRYATVTADTTVADSVRTMSDAARSCAVVLHDGALAGIFTQRDVLLRAIGRPATWRLPVSDLMTRSVRSMRSDQSVAEGLAIMNEWWVRSVPVVDDGDLKGNLSFYAVMEVMADLLTTRLSLSASGLGVIEFVDFTGLHTSPPVTVAAGSTVEVAAHQMGARAIGSVLVVDDRERLTGVVTEYDLQAKIGCDVVDLSSVTVDEIMSPDPLALDARSSIADAIRSMAEHGFSHIPLLGESGRPVAVASFRDVAAYLETSLETIG